MDKKVNAVRKAIQTREVGEKFDTWARSDFTIEELPVAPVAPIDRHTLTTYRIGVQVTATFTCRSATFGQAFEQAARNLSRHVYGDIADLAERMMQATYEHDEETLVRLISELREYIK